MRVAVVTHYFPSSGQLWQGRTAFETLRLLAPTLDLKVFYMEPRPPSLPGRRHQGFDPDFRPAVPDGSPPIDVQYIRYPTLPWIGRGFNGRLAAHSLLPHVRAWRPDLILSYVIYPCGYAGLRLAKALRIPLVTVAIGSDLNRIPNARVGRRIRDTLHGATLTTTVSNDLRRTAIRLGAPPERARAILNGCDLSVFHPRNRTQARRALGLPEIVERGTPSLPPAPSPSQREQAAHTSAATALTAPQSPRPDPETAMRAEGPGERPASSAASEAGQTPAQIVIYVGRLDRAKGVVELVDAAASLHARRPALRVYLMGHGPDEPRVRERIAALHAESFITINPAVPMEEVAIWMAASDLVTLPSYREGCPNVIVEALAAGRPVVATDVGGIPELLDRGSGRMVPPRNSAALAQALEEVLTQPWNAEQLHREHSRSWHDVARDLRTLLHEALTLGAPPSRP